MTDFYQSATELLSKNLSSNAGAHPYNSLIKTAMGFRIFGNSSTTAYQRSAKRVRSEFIFRAPEKDNRLPTGSENQFVVATVVDLIYRRIMPSRDGVQR